MFCSIFSTSLAFSHESWCALHDQDLSNFQLNRKMNHLYAYNNIWAGKIHYVINSTIKIHRTPSSGIFMITCIYKYIHTTYLYIYICIYLVEGLIQNWKYARNQRYVRVQSVQNSFNAAHNRRAYTPVQLIHVIR